DTFAGNRLPISILYIAPVAYAAWVSGARIGTVVAIVAFAARAATDLRWFGLGIITVWNAAAWGLTLLAVARAGGWARARRADVEALEARVSDLVQIEHSFARTDPLTSLSNRRAFV